MSLRFHAVDYEHRDDVAIVTMNNPPMNGLSHAMRLGLVAAFEHAIGEPSVAAIVLTGAGRAFSAGADIRELGSAAASAAPALSLHVHPVIERCPKPTVAAVHGVTMGGGLETALVCHFRVAAGDARIALPEIKLGLIPLSGTQRLPRVMGLQAALDFILESRTLLARDVARDTVFDEVLEADSQMLVDRAVEYARLRSQQGPLPLIRHRSVAAGNTAVVLARARERAVEIGPAATAAVEAMAAAAHAPDFDAGVQQARALFDALSASDEVRRRRDQFFSEHVR